ncbi:hypothetical protein ACFU3E_11205 [Streptomyces sp. NPDC057424]|uniref:hypothetical protein n=1 Tax=Streptomyces sp. NPDC057424 TaxID=3346127 RepID=UPI00367DBA77
MVFAGTPYSIADRIIHLHGLLGHTRHTRRQDLGGKSQRDFLRGVEPLGTMVLPQIRAEPTRP